MESPQQYNIKVCGQWKKAERTDFFEGKRILSVLFAIDQGNGPCANNYFDKLNLRQMETLGELLKEGKVYVWVPDNCELVTNPENAKSINNQ